jgi:hypothetical protein
VYCPNCTYEVPVDDCRLQLDETHLDPGWIGERWRAGCPTCGPFAALKGYPVPWWTGPESGPEVQLVGTGRCALCGEPVKRSHVRDYGRVAWTGWCSMCEATSYRPRSDVLSSSLLDEQG